VDDKPEFRDKVSVKLMAPQFSSFIASITLAQKKEQKATFIAAAFMALAKLCQSVPTCVKKPLLCTPLSVPTQSQSEGGHSRRLCIARVHASPFCAFRIPSSRSAGKVPASARRR
jgi:hypothetical protein